MRSAAWWLELLRSLAARWLRQSLLALGCILLALAAGAGELEDRNAIEAEVAAALERSDYALIESRYAKALAGQTRLRSGVFVANQIVRGILRRELKATGIPLAGDKANSPKWNDKYWKAVEQRMGDWAAQFPDSVLPVIALSRVHERRAWAYRGNGWASTVTEQGWKEFRAGMGRANAVLTRRAEIGRSDPNWWVEMLSIARHAWPVERYWELANAATTAFPRNHDIYLAIAVNLVPQWGGSWQSVAAYADHAVERTRAAEGQAFYARIYRWVERYFEPEFLTLPEANWPRIRDGFDDLIARYPDEWNVNAFLRFACNAEDKPTARRLLTQFKDKVVPSAWESRAAYKRCRDWALG